MPHPVKNVPFESLIASAKPENLIFGFNNQSLKNIRLLGDLF